MQPFAAPTAMKKLSLAFVLFSLVFSVACGSGIGGLIGTGHYNNGSLNGSYVYQITGNDLNSGSAYTESGVFTADGNGKIVSGEDDFSEETSGGLTTPSTDTGTYSVGSDGTGTITLNFSSGSVDFDITLASASKFYLIEADAANASGVGEKQSATTLPSAPTTFVFKQHDGNGVAGTQSSSIVGQFTLATNGTITGSDDENRSGIVNGGAGTGAPLALTGASAFAPPDSNGRGTATIVDSIGTTDLVYYIVDANNLRFIASDSGFVGIGRAEAQTGTFTTDPLSGNSFAFGSRADDATGLASVNTVGSFTASSGTISGGLLDTAIDWTAAYASIPINPTGTYTPVTSNGRSVVALSTSAPFSDTVTQVFWMVSPSRAFFLTASDTSDPSKIEDGTADEQQGTFTTSSLNGQYAFNMDGFDNNEGDFVDRVGWIQWKGNGNLTWNEAVNNSGTIGSSGGLSGTYTVGTNGRAAATVSPGTLSESNNDLVFYLVSGSNAYMLENDAGVEINGAMNLQQ
jgi:hypothetical protein